MYIRIKAFGLYYFCFALLLAFRPTSHATAGFEDLCCTHDMSARETLIFQTWKLIVEKLYNEFPTWKVSESSKMKLYTYNL